MKQKFVHGDEVRVDRKLSSTMGHFRAGGNALVVGSYSDQYGEHSGDEPGYTLFLLPEGDEVSWYPQSSLTLVKRHKDGPMRLRKLKEERADADYAQDVIDMAKEGLVPDGSDRNSWKRRGT